MTDILDRLRTYSIKWHPEDAVDLADEAADEIERLNKALKWEQHWLSRIGTHSPGCWAWGPEHYQCAVRHIEEMSNAS